MALQTAGSSSHAGSAGQPRAAGCEYDLHLISQGGV
jgi:hypothetical protein